jgi:hypothetical protein
MINSRRMRWTGHVANMGEKRNAYKILVGIQKETDCYKDINVRGRIILKWILDRKDGVVRTGFIWLRIGTSGGPL